MEWRQIRIQNQRWRGHIADCNGSIEKIGARAERYKSLENLATHLSTTVEEKKQYEHKLTQERVLEQFRVRVKERVRRRERCKGTLVQNGLLPNTECRDGVTVIGKSVLSQSSNDDVAVVAQKSRTKDDAYKQLAIYCCTSQIDEEQAALIDTTSSIMSVSTVSSQQRSDKKSTIEQGARHMDAVFTTQTLNELNKLQRGDKVSTTHRLYSQQERQHSRVWVVQQQQQHQTWLHREARELKRRLLEGRDEKSKIQDESVKQWTESNEEQQKKSEQHAKELKRYCEALYRQRRIKHYKNPSPPPSLCSCHSSLWECNPISCAANCAYRQNHSAYSRALHSFLHSLNT